MGMAHVEVEHHCPGCDGDHRCKSQKGSLRCQRDHGHPGVHLAETGPGRALRWGETRYGCTDPDCKRPAGHELPHSDHRGSSWRPWDDDHPDAGKVPSRTAEHVEKRQPPEDGDDGR